ncbi:probable LRR receptor-like serine/threonine-protein kinase At4g36180 isoform X1 [Olea europaea var. sylvestris]|uniref:probable LRR receptor-like serine/threonine-protein kinase At4g36180 isoform X1 n=2 Tax=Olea europaea var. sylvestris TaxID=158386 RepID=UPI000C1CF8D6|nr:probable LRR receptor-like serine/threonine-protein kinase At4g36180 isoform X1 [Olea europaea var. sylvestris]
MVLLGCWEEEKVALLHLRANINFPDGESLSSWVVNETATDCCQWESVESSNTTKRVIQLDLDYVRERKLGDWYFNASLFLPFRELRNLFLEQNQLVGWVENEGIDRLSKLRNLEALDLSWNSFDNKILSFLSRLSSLKYLRFGNNYLMRKKFSNSSERLFGLTKLEVLDFKGNDDISNGDILSMLNLNDFINLKELDLSENQFGSSGTIYGIKSMHRLRVLKLDGISVSNISNLVQPLRAFSYLEHFYFRDNYINESIGTFELRHLRLLEGLFLDNSTVDGNLLQSIGALSSLKILSLSRCKLNGNLPVRELRHLRQLEQLFLDYSDVDGNFLQSIGALSSLKILSLSSCGLNGTLPVRGWCELKTLQELYLMGNEYEGMLPSCVANMTSLRSIGLSSNKFTGNVASSPLSKLTSLEYLSLSSNHFQVPISFKAFFNHSNLKHLYVRTNEIINENELEKWVPSFQLEDFDISNCSGHPKLPNFFYYQSNLRFIGLSKNNIGGNFPTWLLENNTRLVQLYLSANAFTGTLMLPTSSNHDMQAFDVSNNKFNGRIPINITSIFPNLYLLNMSTNMFDGCIPSSFGDLKYIDQLDLSNNNLSGTISSSLSTINSRVLDISNNHLFGRIPTSVGNMTYSMIVSMSNNQLEGPIPVEICNLKDLLLLDLSHNKLCGSVPSCFNTSTISHVYLNNNQLEGELIEAFYNSSSLELLDLRENKFTGSIPQWIGTLSSMRFFLLSGNHFEGTIPHQFCEMNKLSMIDLSFNFLSGQIPQCFGNISLGKTKENSELTIIVLDRVPIIVAFTTKKNSYPYKGYILNNMSGIDLSSNKLHGEIPDSFGKLSEIHAINLSHNNLNGTIPATFSSLHQIESLDLSYNNLGGKIPNDLIELNTLEVFSVAHNNLIGTIPEKGQFGTFGEDSYQGNPYLCGRPLPVNCTSTRSSPVLPSANDESEERGFMDMEVFYVSFIVSYICVVLCIATVLYINPHWRRVWFHFIEIYTIQF